MSSQQGGGKWECLSVICPTATLSTTNPSWLSVGLNPGLSTDSMSADHLNCSMAKVVFLIF